MLSADFGHLDRDTRMVHRSAAEWIHIDVMDGVFVPKQKTAYEIASGDWSSDVCSSDLVEPERYVGRFAEAGADILTFHYEATADVRACIGLIRKAGARVGISVKPATPVGVLRDILPLVDMVLIMSVEPGFGGQAFIPEALQKIADLRAMARQQGLDTLIEVDGGISARNAGEIYAAGADILVAGSSVFGAADPQAEIVRMLEA